MDDDSEATPAEPNDEKVSTAFESKDRTDDSGKTDTLFNREDDGEEHGHVVTSNEGQDTHYARDEKGNVYVDDSKEPGK